MTPSNDTLRDVTYLYFDEAGNFDFSTSGTSVFVMTCVVTKRPFTAHNALLEVKYDVMESGLNLEYFHATEDRQAVRDQVFSAIGASLDDFAAYSVILQRDCAAPSLRQPHVLYRRMFEWLVERACPRVGSPYGHVVAITDQIPVQRNRRAFEKGLKPYLKQHLPAGSTYDLFHHQSKADLNLQIADYICWAIYRKWNTGDERSFELIRGCVRSEESLGLEDDGACS